MNNHTTLYNFLCLMHVPGFQSLQQAYSVIQFPEETANLIYDTFIPLSGCHRTMLPVEFFISNATLIPRLLADLDRYKPAAFDIWTCDLRSFPGPWKELVLDRIIERPELVGDVGASLLAIATEAPKLWGSHYNNYKVSCQNLLSKWVESKPLLLAVINMALYDDARRTYRQLFSSLHKSVSGPLREDIMETSASFLELWLKDGYHENYSLVLDTIRTILQGESISKLCLWHGKLLLIALNSASSLVGRIDVKYQYLCAYLSEYDVETFSFPILLSILYFAADGGLCLQRSGDVAEKLSQLQERHVHLPPIWKGRDDLISYWRCNADTVGKLKWPHDTLSVFEAVTLIGKKFDTAGYGEICTLEFERPLSIRTSDCTSHCFQNVLDLLKDFPKMLSTETKAFIEAKDGVELQNDFLLPPYFWETVGRVIVQGFFYLGYDVFRLTQSTWDLIYEPNETSPYKELHQILDVSHLLDFKGSNRIQ